MAPVVRALQDDRAFEANVVISAQHRGMLDQVLDLFDISVDGDLDLMRPGQSLTDITTDVLKKFEPLLKKFKPDLVLVHGDTSTTFAGALAAFYQKIPVGHVEAGLRTGDIYQPFPEEVNRRLTDPLCSLYFAPTALSRKNLLAEKTEASRVFVTGNTVIDALLWTASLVRRIQSEELKDALKQVGRYPLILLTAHRRENFGKPFDRVFGAVTELTRRFPNHHWIYPVHPNPSVKQAAKKWLGKSSNVHLISPLDYADLVTVLKKSTLVVTDSGGLQEEAPSLGKPVLVLREVTERPEAVRAGTVRLVGTDPRLLKSSVSQLLTNSKSYRRMAAAVNPYGDGRASERIVKAIRWHFGLSRKPPQPFVPKLSSSNVSIEDPASWA